MNRNRMQVLIIEPTKTYRLLLDAFFRNNLCKTVLITSGEKGLEIIEEERFDLVCISCHLDDMEGIDFSRSLRAQNKRNLPVIMVTSKKEKEVYTEGMAAGITEIFRKEDLITITDYLTTIIKQAEADDRLSGHVLYVEDDLPVSELVKYQLTLMGLTIKHTTNGKEALELFTTFEYDLVITDILLDGPMSGLGLTRAICRLKERKNIPILAMSGFDDLSRRINILRSGANDYISKPFIQEEFTARVKNLITSKQLLDQVEVQQQRLEEMAMRDPLTSLYNRNGLNELVPKYISDAVRHHRPLSLIVIDLDHFKSINDTHGHDTGDLVLREVSDLIKESCRKEDLPARFGGEEFILILPHCRGKDAVGKAEILRKKIEHTSPSDISVTASFGVYQLPPEAKASIELKDLFVLADKALYEAKEKGRNCVVLYEKNQLN